MYSTAFGNDNTTYEQVIEWTNFMGGGAFCFKTCNPAGANAAALCQHIYDRIGCAYNSPNAAQNGTFEACDGDDQDPAGIYTDSTGATQTYTQPAESLGAISSMPYQPRVPASSNCVTYTSSVLYASAAADPSVSGPAGSSSTPAVSGGSHSSSKPAGSSSKSSGSVSPTATGASSDTGGASSMVVSSMSSIVGIALAVAFLA